MQKAPHFFEAFRDPAGIRTQFKYHRLNSILCGFGFRLPESLIIIFDTFELQLLYYKDNRT